MKQLSPLLETLIEHLQCLPGVGRKSAQRMALYLLERDREGGRDLGLALTQVMNAVKRCECCRIHTEQQLCPLCQDPRRDASVLCVVETPADVLAIEQTGSYRGRYYVLHGRVSPLDGIGPDQLGFSGLMSRFEQKPAITEVILATSMTPEGEATAHYLAQLLQQWCATMEDGAPLPEGQLQKKDQDQPRAVQVTRIAHGVPIGGDIDVVNGTTLSYALSERKAMVVS